MPHTARRALAAFLIALHAAIAACGPGLHAAPGLGHAARSAETSAADGTPALAHPSINLAEHCPLCDYFAQGQLPIARACWASSPLVVPAEPARPALLPPAPPLPTSRSRAPPLGDSRLA